MTSGAIGSHAQRSAISAMMTAAALQPCAKLGGSLLQVTTPQSAYNDQRQALPYERLLYIRDECGIRSSMLQSSSNLNLN